MKKLLLAFFMLVYGLTAIAQDVIVLKDGDFKKVKVIEVGENDVKYKKWENIEGPTYTISISNILAINYQNGTKDSFANYKEKKSDVAQSIDAAGSNVSKSITTSGNNISKGLDNSVYLSQQKMISSGKIMKITGDIILLVGIGVGIAAGVATGEFWITGVCCGAGLLLGFPLYYFGEQKIRAAERIVSTNIFQHKVNEHFALNACYLEHSPSRQKALGAGVSIRF